MGTTNVTESTELIAERWLGRDSDAVHVQLYRPCRVVDAEHGAHWTCRYRVLSQHLDHAAQEMIGEDAFQALTGALNVMRVQVTKLGYDLDDPEAWSDGPPDWK